MESCVALTVSPVSLIWMGLVEYFDAVSLTDTAGSEKGSHSRGALVAQGTITEKLSNADEGASLCSTVKWRYPLVVGLIQLILAAGVIEQISKGCAVAS